MWRWSKSRSSLFILIHKKMLQIRQINSFCLIAGRTTYTSNNLYRKYCTSALRYVFTITRMGYGSRLGIKSRVFGRVPTVKSNSLSLLKVMNKWFRNHLDHLKSSIKITQICQSNPRSHHLFHVLCWKKSWELQVIFSYQFSFILALNVAIRNP